MAELGLIGTATGENSKLELGRARFKAGWGLGVRWLNGESMDVMNQVIVTQPCRIKRAGSASHGGREGRAGLAWLVLALAASNRLDPRQRLRTRYMTTQPYHVRMHGSKWGCGMHGRSTIKARR